MLPIMFNSQTELTESHIVLFNQDAPIHFLWKMWSEEYPWGTNRIELKGQGWRSSRTLCGGDFAVRMSEGLYSRSDWRGVVRGVLFSLWLAGGKFRTRPTQRCHLHVWAHRAANFCWKNHVKRYLIELDVPIKNIPLPKHLELWSWSYGPE